MKGGNEVRKANVVTLCSKGEIPSCVAVNAHGMAPVSGANLMAKAVKECGSLQTPRDRGKPFRPAGSRTYRPPKKTFTFNLKDYIKYLLLLFASGVLAYFSLAWPWLNVWLQEVSLRVEEDPMLIYTVLKTVPILLISLPILLLMLGCGVYMSWTAAKSPYLSIRFCAHLILIAYITIFSFLCLFRILQLLHFGFFTTLFLLYVIVGVIYVRLLYVNSSKKESPQPTDENEN